MNRGLWSRTITKSTCPAWQCRMCETGIVNFEPTTLTYEETVASRREHDDEAWDPEWIDYAFTAWATCSNPLCKQKYAISGKGGVQQEYLDEGESDWFDFFVPLHCQPMPDIITLPKRCPEEISKTLREAFSLYYSDTASCAGKIRVALEKLMDHLKIDADKECKSGKRTRVQLHERLQIFEKHQPQIASHLLAIKWFGNTAIHENGRVSNEDILDAFEIIEDALKEIIDQRTAHIAKLAAKLIDRHAPPSTIPKT